MTSASPKPALRLVPPVPASDEALCRRFVAGEGAALGELLQRHQELVYRLVRRYAPSADAACCMVEFTSR